MATNANMLIYGRHPVMEALKSDKSIEKVIIQAGTNNDIEIELRDLSRKKLFQLQYVPKEKFNKITSNNHQGIAAYISHTKYHEAPSLCNSILKRVENPLIIILDGVTDVRNFGAIARSAEAAGANALIIQHKGSAPINAESIKASAGALTKIKIGRINSLAELIGHLQNTDWQVLGSDLQATKPLMEVDFDMPTAVIVGAEGRGISPYLLKTVDESFIIPQVGKTDSLNVSVATGIILYEALRQKLAKV